MTDDQIVEVDALFKRIAPLFNGQPPDIVGAVLADLLSLLLAGYQGPDAESLREELLALHVATVRNLIPVNEALLLGKKGTLQ